MKSFRKLRIKFLILSLMGLLLTGCGAGGFGQAIEDCQSLVEDRLRAPGTAKFVDVEVEKVDDSYFEIRGSVDAENGFGALLRANFKCSGYDKKDVKLIYLSDPN